jgi:hypothetical protein
VGLTVAESDDDLSGAEQTHYGEGEDLNGDRAKLKKSMKKSMMDPSRVKIGKILNNHKVFTSKCQINFPIQNNFRTLSFTWKLAHFDYQKNV